MTTTTTAHPAEVLLDAQAAGALHLPVCDHYSGVEERMRKSCSHAGPITDHAHTRG